MDSDEAKLHAMIAKTQEHRAIIIQAILRGGPDSATSGCTAQQMAEVYIKAVNALQQMRETNQTDEYQWLAWACVYVRNAFMTGELDPHTIDSEGLCGIMLADTVISSILKEQAGKEQDNVT